MNKITIIFFIFIFSINIYAKDIVGWENLKWGMSMKKVIKESKTVIIRKEKFDNGTMLITKTMKKFEAINVMYIFLKKKLFSVVVTYQPGHNFFNVVRECNKKYGKDYLEATTDYEDSRHIIWRLKKTIVHLKLTNMNYGPIRTSVTVYKRTKEWKEILPESIQTLMKIYGK